MKQLPRPDLKARNIPKDIKIAFELIATPLASVEERIRAQARQVLKEALEALCIVPKNPYRSGLEDLCKSVDRLLKQFA